MSTENKGYKFRLEYTRTVYLAGDDKTPPGSDNFTFVAYGDSVKETIQGIRTCMTNGIDSWRKKKGVHSAIKRT